MGYIKDSFTKVGNAVQDYFADSRNTNIQINAKRRYIDNKSKSTLVGALTMVVAATSTYNATAAHSQSENQTTTIFKKIATVEEIVRYEKKQVAISYETLNKEVKDKIYSKNADVESLFKKSETLRTKLESITDADDISVKDTLQIYDSLVDLYSTATEKLNQKSQVKLYGKTFTIENVVASLLKLGEEKQEVMDNLTENAQTYKKLKIDTEVKKEVYNKFTDEFLKITANTTPKEEMESIDAANVLMDAAFLGYRNDGKFGGQDKEGRFSGICLRLGIYGRNYDVNLKYYHKNLKIVPAKKGENINARVITMKKFHTYFSDQKMKDKLKMFAAFDDSDKHTKMVALAIKEAQLSKGGAFSNIDFQSLYSAGLIQIEGQHKTPPKTGLKLVMFTLGALLGSHRNKELLDLAKKNYRKRINFDLDAVSRDSRLYNRAVTSLNDEEKSELAFNQRYLAELVSPLTKNTLVEKIVKRTVYEKVRVQVPTKDAKRIQQEEKAKEAKTIDSIVQPEISATKIAQVVNDRISIPPEWKFKYDQYIKVEELAAYTKIKQKFWKTFLGWKNPFGSGRDQSIVLRFDNKKNAAYFQVGNDKRNSVKIKNKKDIETVKKIMPIFKEEKKKWLANQQMAKM